MKSRSLTTLLQRELNAHVQNLFGRPMKTKLFVQTERTEAEYELDQRSQVVGEDMEGLFLNI